MQRDHQGRFWLFSTADPPALFDASGRFLRMLGRKGRGPGEYVAPHVALFLEDSVVVLDGRQRRASVLNEKLEYVRAILMPSQMYRPILISWPDSIIMADRVPAPRSDGWPIHLVSLAGTAGSGEGKVLRSFAQANGKSPPDDNLFPWFVALASDGFWAAPPTSYELVHWKRDGLVETRTLRRQPNWFRESSASIGNPAIGGVAATPPSPAITGIEEDEAGLLWVYTHVPSPSWQETWSAFNEKPRMQVRPSEVHLEKLYQTRIEVIDPKAGRVLTRTTVDGFFVVNAMPGHRLAVYTTDDEARGEKTSVLQFDLVRPGR